MAAGQVCACTWQTGLRPQCKVRSCDVVAARWLAGCAMEALRAAHTKRCTMGLAHANSGVPQPSLLQHTGTRTHTPSHGGGRAGTPRLRRSRAAALGSTSTSSRHQSVCGSHSARASRLSGGAAREGERAGRHTPSARLSARRPRAGLAAGCVIQGLHRALARGSAPPRGAPVRMRLLRCSSQPLLQVHDKHTDVVERAPLDSQSSQLIYCGLVLACMSDSSVVAPLQRVCTYGGRPCHELLGSLLALYVVPATSATCRQSCAAAVHGGNRRIAPQAIRGQQHESVTGLDGVCLHIWLGSDIGLERGITNGAAPTSE